MPRTVPRGSGGRESACADIIGEGELVLPGGELRFATVEEVEPGEHLSLWWHAEGALAPRVRVRRDDVPDGTRVVVVETGYAGAPICGSPWASSASSGPRARSGAAATASPSFALGSAWVLSAIDWQPALERLRRAGDSALASWSLQQGTTRWTSRPSGPAPARAAPRLAARRPRDTLSGDAGCAGGCDGPVS